MAERQTGSALFYGDAVTATGSTQLYPLGTRREEEGKTYRYVKFETGAVTALANGLCGFVSLTGSEVPGDEHWVVTMDISASNQDLVAGKLTAVIANGEFGWIQTKGPATLIGTSSAGNIGDKLTWKNDDTGAAEGLAGFTQRTAAMCIKAGSGVAVYGNLILD
jgi:hypothetical protein